MGEPIHVTKATAATGARNQDDAVAKPKTAKRIKLGEVKQREPKWTFSSRLKNFFVAGRKEAKVQAWNEAKRKESERETLWKKTAVSLPYNATQGVEKHPLPNPSLESGGQSSRKTELQARAQKLRASDFKALFRDDATLPHEWLVEQRLALQPVVDAMKGRLQAALGNRDPSKLSDVEKHEIATKVWSILIPGLHNSYQQEIPDDSKYLVKELLQSLASSPEFKGLNQAERNDAIKGAFYFAYFNRGIQPMLAKGSTRLQELSAIPKRELTSSQKAEFEKENASASLATQVADFGAAICGLKAAGKTTAIVPTEDEIGCGKAFYGELSDELCKQAGIARALPELPDDSIDDHEDGPTVPQAYTVRATSDEAADGGLPELPFDPIDDVEHSQKASSDTKPQAVPKNTSAKPDWKASAKGKSARKEPKITLMRQDSGESAAARALKVDLHDKLANPFAEDDEIEDLQHQVNSSKPAPSKLTDEQAPHIQAALKGLENAVNAEPTKGKDVLLKGAGKLKKNLTTAAKIAGEGARVYTSEETKRMRMKLPPALAGLSDIEVGSLSGDLKKGTDNSADAVRKLLRGNAPTTASIDDPVTYISGYVHARDFVAKGRSEGTLCNDLLTRLSRLPGGAAIVDEFNRKKVSKLTLDQLEATAKTLPETTSREKQLKNQMLNFLRGAAEGLAA